MIISTLVWRPKTKIQLVINHAPPDRRNTRTPEDPILSGMTDFWTRAYGKPEADRRRQIIEAKFRKNIPEAK